MFTNSIILVLSVKIARLCYFAKFSLMQSTEAPMSGKAWRVARFSPWLFFTFIFKFNMGIGMPDIAAFAAGLDIKHFVLVDCLTMFSVFTLKYSFFLLLFSYNTIWACTVPFMYNL